MYAVKAEPRNPCVLSVPILCFPFRIYISILNMMYSMLIFNMVSELNFVLGIKQTSLASKEEYYVHTIIRSHTCFSAGS